MGDWLRKLRGLAGLSAFGGVAGALFGVLMIIVTSVVWGVGGISLMTLVSGAIPWALIGAVSAGGAGLAIVTLDSHKSLPELSAPRTALYGGVLGAACLLAMLLLLTPGVPLAALSIGAGCGAALGGGIGGGLVAAAKRADRASLTRGGNGGRTD